MSLVCISEHISSLQTMASGQESLLCEFSVTKEVMGLGEHSSRPDEAMPRLAAFFFAEPFWF